MSNVPAATIVVPVLDEEKNILPLLTRLSQALGLAQLNGEVLFIDDSSGPATDEAIHEATATLQSATWRSATSPVSAR